MKFIFLFLIFIPNLLFSQIYTPKDFFLNGRVRKVSVLVYNFILDSGKYVEDFPNNNQDNYHTDLNLHYLEFDIDNRLVVSRLFYPRGFYGQFENIKPEFDLEKSDFSERENYLTNDYRYKYIDLKDNKTQIEVIGNLGKTKIIIDDMNNIIEDEYYIYDRTISNKFLSVLKRRKDSKFNYRRSEKEYLDNKIITREYLNTNFLQSKKMIKTSTNRTLELFISSANILLKERILTDGMIIQNEINLNWRNIIYPWPSIDFNENLSYDEYKNMISRDVTEYQYEYSYEENKLKESRKYIIENNLKYLLSTQNYYYDINNNLIKNILFKVENGKEKKYYKNYEYDNKNNWIQKEIGEIILTNLKEERVPTKKYVKTLLYWD